MTTNKIHGKGFQIGDAFKTAQVHDPKEYLDAVLGAEKLISKSAHVTKDGIFWKKEGQTWSRIRQDEIDQSFYSGTAGILYFYLKLYEATKEEQFFHMVQEGTRYLSLHWSNFLHQSNLFGLPGIEQGIYMGIGGIAMVLDEVYQATEDKQAKEASLAIFNYYKTTAKEDENGVYWTGSTALAMDGGIILLLLSMNELYQKEEIRELLVKAADWYLRQGEEKEGGLEFNGCKNFSSVSWPNYEFGTAGAGFLLTRLYEVFHEERYLNAAKACAIYMKSVQVPQKNGYLVPHDVYGPEEEEPVFFLSSCHGPGGNSKMYWELYRLTKDAEYLDEIKEMTAGIESQGAPTKSSRGFWNTWCFCCGHAGLVHFFIGMYLGTKDRHYYDLARQSASVIMGEKEENEDGTVVWPMAFWRIHPEWITTDLGYYDGQSGVASSLLELYLLETDQFHWKRLPDDPFPEEEQHGK